MSEISRRKSRPKAPRSLRRLAAAASIPLVAIAVGAAVASSASAETTPAPETPACVWSEASAAINNSAAPDSSATYWGLQYTVQPGLQIVLNGQYPDSLYMSFANYTSGGSLFTTGDGASSNITDYQIQPDRGSVNPFQAQPTGRSGDLGYFDRRAHGLGPRFGWLRGPHWAPHQGPHPSRRHGSHWSRQHDPHPGRHNPPGDSYTLTLASEVSPGATNTIQLAPTGTPAGTTGYALLRVYLPAGGVPSVKLPTVTFERDGQSVQVPQCPNDELPLPTSSTTTAPPASAPSPVPTGPSYVPARATTPVPFVRAGGSGGGNFPNPDSGYLAASISPPTQGDVLVIRGKAPTAVAGDSAEPWPARGTDMRYWSMCNYVSNAQLPLVVNQLTDGSLDYGCRNDDEVSLDRGGYYTIVVGTEAQRNAIDRIPGATFLPYSDVQPETKQILLLRNMLVNPEFTQSVLNIPSGSSAATAEQIMGPYYPHAATCPLTTVAKRGAQACLSTSS